MAVDAVVPIFRAAVEAAEGALLRMHEQGFGGDAPPAVAAPSPYMAELARQLSHFRCGPAAPRPRAAGAAPPAARACARACAGQACPGHKHREAPARALTLIISLTLNLTTARRAPGRST